MNRRTFLKSVGVTVVVITTPFSIAKAKPRWINFTEEMPKVGQKVALFTYFANNRPNISTGKVMSNDEADTQLRYWGYRGYKYPDHTVITKGYISYSLDGFFIDEDVRAYDLVEDGEFLGDKVKRAKWIKGDRISHYSSAMLIPRHGLKISEYVGRNESYWCPIDEYIPVNLPALPKPKKLNIEYRCGPSDHRTMLIKE